MRVIVWLKTKIPWSDLDNATWQGEVTWAEANKKKSFRSALELIRLIDGALEVDE